MDPFQIEAVTFPLMVMFIFGSIAYIVTRVMRHREIISYAKQGMHPPQDLRGFNRHGPTPRLRRGIITSFVGLTLTIGLSSIGFGPWLLGGLIPLGVGVALMIIGGLEMAAPDLPFNYDFGNEDDDEDHEAFDPIPAHKVAH